MNKPTPTLRTTGFKSVNPLVNKVMKFVNSVKKFNIPDSRKASPSANENSSIATLALLIFASRDCI